MTVRQRLQRLRDMFSQRDGLHQMVSAGDRRRRFISLSLAAYLGVYLLFGIGGVSFPVHAALAGVYDESNTAAPAGSVWIEGDAFHYAEGSMEYTIPSVSATLVDGSSSGASGSVWIEGGTLHWIDSQDDEMSYTGQDSGRDPSGASGSLWMETENAGERTLHYIDENGNERFIDLSYGEAGTTSGLSDNEWLSQSLSANFASKPLVFATTQTTNGGDDPSAAHVRSVSVTGFDTQHCEWEDGNSCDNHADETNGWVAVDPDRINSRAGMEAGTFVTSDGTEVRTSVSFSSTFDNTPYVFAQIQSQHTSTAPFNVQVDSVDTSGFTLEYCNQDSNDGCGAAGSEVVAWWAIDPNVASKDSIFDWGSVSVSDSNWNAVSFSTSYGSAPAVIAMTQTESGGPEALYPEVRSVGTGGADVRYCEAETDGTCDTHATETVAWLAVKTGKLYP